MRIRSIFYLPIVSVLFIFLSSCNTYKEVPLFHDLPQQGEISETITNYTPLLIQPNDILAIAVSSLNPEASVVFNPPTELISGGSNQNNQNNQNDIGARGFLVDQKGDIRLPYIGALKVAGLNRSDINELITQKLEKYLKEPVVNIRVLNFKIAVFGGVNGPGIYTINNERVTVVEALILAGDLNLTSLRNNILLVREINGERKYVRLDFRSRSVFTSPYFYLKTNDLLYIEPGVSIEKRDNIFGNISILATVISLFLVFTRL